MTDWVPATERRNPASARLDALPVESVLRLMNSEEARVSGAVAEALPQISGAVELLVEGWRRGGRWIYVGAGTSGRLAALDAAECPPTFGVPPERILALIAGGESAAGQAMEDAEDDGAAAVRDLEGSNPSPIDVVVGLAASGRTPYVLAAVEHASETGCATIGIANNPGSRLTAIADVGIELDTGPEILTGSTRLKAGTAQKMVLNMLSTASFAQLGKVHENFMVDVQATNEKLRHRARRMVQETTGASETEAGELLHAAGGSAKVAIVMGGTGVCAAEAQGLLDTARGSVRRALEAVTAEDR
jgi:N-acetylmuramic acid 6-phosphate etherase